MSQSPAGREPTADARGRREYPAGVPGESTLIIGVDCATQTANTGVACGHVRGHELVFMEASTASDPIARQLSTWMETDDSIVVALDAPLGWPRSLGRQLMGHRAGEGVRASANSLFRRRTDDFIAERFGKRPLEVGADRIARTAVSALQLLDDLRDATKRPIPLGWRPGTPAEAVALEVYPAALLLSLGLPASGYKGSKPECRERRRQLVEALEQAFDLHEAPAAAMTQSDHVLDAALCVLAGFYFVRGEVLLPDDEGLARREGWIWTRPMP